MARRWSPEPLRRGWSLIAHLAKLSRVYQRQGPEANSNSVLSVSVAFSSGPSVSAEPRALGPGNKDWQARIRVQLVPGNGLSSGQAE
ncbi:hypothetical protein NQZ68_019142 [Dissostichus eleginoides]|nr:hypothetical protein NQZ68_019142 [Dissostichus eleginoides]